MTDDTVAHLSVQATRGSDWTTLSTSVRGPSPEQRVVIAVFLRNFKTFNQFKWQDQKEVQVGDACDFTLKHMGGHLMLVAYAVVVSQDTIRSSDKLGRVFVDMGDIIESPGGRWESVLDKHLEFPNNPTFDATSVSPASSSFVTPTKPAATAMSRPPDQLLRVLVECRNLPQLDWLEENDSMVALFEEKINRTTGDTRFDYLDQTEWVEAKNDPKFQKELLVNYFAGSAQKFKFSVYNVASEHPEYIPTEHDLLGAVEVDMDAVVHGLEEQAGRPVAMVERQVVHEDQEKNTKLRARGTCMTISLATGATTGPPLPLLCVPEGITPGGGKAEAEEEEDTEVAPAKLGALNLIVGEGSPRVGELVSIEPGRPRKERFAVTRGLGLFQCRMLSFGVQCCNLIQRDWLVPNDPVAALYCFDPASKQLQLADQTEFIENTNSPAFSKSVEVEYVPDARQVLRLCVYDVDGLTVPADRLLGYVDLPLDHLVNVVADTQDRQYMCRLQSDDESLQEQLQAKDSCVVVTLVMDKATQITDYRQPLGELYRDQVEGGAPPRGEGQPPPLTPTATNDPGAANNTEPEAFDPFDTKARMAYTYPDTYIIDEPFPEWEEEESPRRYQHLDTAWSSKEERHDCQMPQECTIS